MALLLVGVSEVEKHTQRWMNIMEMLETKNWQHFLIFKK